MTYESICEDIENNVIKGNLLTEALSPEDRKRVDYEFAETDVRPCAFDITWQAWLIRIGTWGKLTFQHIDPEFHGKKKMDITQRQFLSRIVDPNMLKAFGMWHIDRLNIDTVEIYRDYEGLDGKKKRESFIITVVLNDELKKALGKR